MSEEESAPGIVPSLVPILGISAMTSLSNGIVTSMWESWMENAELPSLLTIIGIPW